MSRAKRWILVLVLLLLPTLIIALTAYALPTPFSDSSGPNQVDPQNRGAAFVISDSVPPSGTFTSPAHGTVLTSTLLTLTVDAEDNPGGSGVREVRYNAMWQGEWHGIGVDTAAPYSLTWNVCASGVPAGDVELGMEVWDNAGNQWIWGDHNSNPVINKDYNCHPAAAGEGVYLYRNQNQSGGQCYVTQDAPSIGDYCNDAGYGSDWDDNAESIMVSGDYHYALFKEENYGGAPFLANFSGNLPTEWRNQSSSIRIRRTTPASFTLWSLPGWIGQSFASDRTIYDLGTWGYNNVADSISVTLGYEVILCEQANFHGLCGRTDQPVADLDTIAPGLSGETTSVRVCAGSCPPAPDVPAPINPVNDSLFAPGSTILFQWTGNGAQYKIDYSGGGQSGSSGWINGSQWSPGVLPKSNQPYTWRVRAWNDYGESDWSEVQTLYVQETPLPPSDLVISGTAEFSLTLSWQDNSADEDGFNIYRWEAVNGGFGFVFLDRVGADVTTYDSLFLNCETVYSYTVAAYYGILESEAAPPAEGTTDTCQPTVYLPLILSAPANQPPYVPSNPTPADGATNQETSLTLQWQGGDPDGDAVTYDVYIRSQNSSSYTVLCATIPSSSCTTGQLNDSTTYEWYVVARDEHGLTAEGPVWRFTTKSAPPPSCSNPIINGGFEGNDGWTLGVNEYPAAYSTSVVHSGGRSMRIGITYSGHNRYAYSSAWQFVAIPAGVSKAAFNFWLYPMSSGSYVEAPLKVPAVVPTSKAEAPTKDDTQFVLLYDQWGQQHILVYQRSNAGTWQGYSFDLGAFAGQTVKLYFGVFNNGYGGVTSMYVDDVSLEVCP